MKKKILTILLVGLFLLTSSTSLSVLGIDSSIVLSNQESNNTIEIASLDGYPDLVPEFDYISKGGRYTYETTIKNVGNNIAIISQGCKIYTRNIKYLFGLIRENDWIIAEDLVLLPGESATHGGHFDLVILAFGSIHTITADPDNVVDEGVEGESNNVEIVRCIKEKSLTKKNIINQILWRFFERYQIFFTYFNIFLVMN